MDVYKLTVTLLFTVIIVELRVAKFESVEIKLGTHNVILPLDGPVHVKRIKPEQLENLKFSIPDLLGLVAKMRGYPIVPPHSPPQMSFPSDHNKITQRYEPLLPSNISQLSHRQYSEYPANEISGKQMAPQDAPPPPHWVFTQPITDVQEGTKHGNQHNTPYQAAHDAYSKPYVTSYNPFANNVALPENTELNLETDESYSGRYETTELLLTTSPSSSSKLEPKNVHTGIDQEIHDYISTYPVILNATTEVQIGDSTTEDLSEITHLYDATTDVEDVYTSASTNAPTLIKTSKLQNPVPDISQINLFEREPYSNYRETNSHVLTDLPLFMTTTNTYKRYTQEVSTNIAVSFTPETEAITNVQETDAKNTNTLKFNKTTEFYSKDVIEDLTKTIPEHDAISSQEITTNGARDLFKINTKLKARTTDSLAEVKVSSLMMSEQTTNNRTWSTTIATPVTSPLPQNKFTDVDSVAAPKKTRKRPCKQTSRRVRVRKHKSPGAGGRRRRCRRRTTRAPSSSLPPTPTYADTNVSE